VQPEKRPMSAPRYMPDTMVAYFVYGFAMFAAWPSMKTEFMKYRTSIIVGAGDGDRTRDIQLGKLAFYR
jgi:hypothetical protein